MSKEASPTGNTNKKTNNIWLPWLRNLRDIIAAVLILAAAILGAAEKIKTANTDVRIGVACVLIGLAAMGLIERLFERR